jgi:hypothetical protein
MVNTLRARREGTLENHVRIGVDEINAPIPNQSAKAADSIVETIQEPIPSRRGSEPPVISVHDNGFDSILRQRL